MTKEQMELDRALDEIDFSDAQAHLFQRAKNRIFLVNCIFDFILKREGFDHIAM